MGWVPKQFWRFCGVFLVGAIVYGAMSTLAAAANVQFVGSVGYSSDYATFTILVVDNIQNDDSSGTSAALRVELWASPQPFSDFSSGYRSAQYEVAPLHAGSSTGKITATVPFSSPPRGTWYFAIVLTEYTGASTNDGYTARNVLRFPGALFISGPTSPPPDTTPPTVSIASPTSGNVFGTVTISANASDNVGVSRVDFYINGSLVGSDSTSPYQYVWNTTTLPNGTASLSAKAFDAAGNSGQSSLVSVTVANGAPPDTTPPTVEIVSPSPGSVGGSVMITANASDNVGVTRVEFYVNGSLIATDFAPPWQATWNTTKAAGRSVSVVAVAYDAAGNRGTSPSVQMEVANPGAPPPPDSTAPTAAISSPTGGSVSGTVSVKVNASDDVGVAGVVGVVRVDLLANGHLVASSTTAPWQFAWNSTGVADGIVQLQAVAYDAAGNAGTSPAVMVTVANAGSPSTQTTAYAVEYYNATLDHYFMTAAQSDIDVLDAGTIAGWVRTGYAFKVDSQPVTGASPVCRIYIPPAYGDSHFFSASPTECVEAIERSPSFVYETADAFYIDTPDASGNCPAGDAPVYRLWNHRADINHRYTTSWDVRQQMVAQGYVPEGYGPNAVMMCSPP